MMPKCRKNNTAYDTDETLLFMCSYRGSGKHGCCYVSLKPKRVQELNKQPSHYKMHSSLVHSILHNMQFVQMIEDMPLRLIVFQCQYIFSSTHEFHTLFCVCGFSSVEEIFQVRYFIFDTLY